MEEPESRLSPYNRFKQKLDKKMDKMTDKLRKEVNEELQDNERHVNDAQGVALDLVDHETLDKLVEIIREKPEIEAGCDKWLWFHIIRKTFSQIIFKTIDIGTDLAAAGEHMQRRDWKYAALTLFFVYLPGFVLSAGFTMWGLFYKREGDPPARKAVTLERLGKYIGLLFLFPFAYPIIQILLGVLLVGLLIRRRDHVARKFMGHDLKQFKSMEGFLESGPSFCLQTYILMIGHKKGTNIDWDNIDHDDVERLLLLSCSSLFSFISLVKTSYSVNVPDPDPRRKQQQYKKNAPCFKLTLLLFKLFTILYRILSISYFCVYLKEYTMIIIIAGFLCNLITFQCVGSSPTISIILGAISLFVPNGYILHNFAGTLEVDFSRAGSKVVFFVSTLVVNAIWFCGVISVFVVYTGQIDLNIEHIITDSETQKKFILGMNIALTTVGVISSLLGIVHWYCSIEKLFIEPEADPEQVELEEKPEEETSAEDPIHID